MKRQKLKPRPGVAAQGRGDKAKQFTNNQNNTAERAHIQEAVRAMDGLYQILGEARVITASTGGCDAISEFTQAWQRFRECLLAGDYDQASAQLRRACVNAGAIRDERENINVLGGEQ